MILKKKQKALSHQFSEASLIIFQNFAVIMVKVIDVKVIYSTR